MSKQVIVSCFTKVYKEFLILLVLVLFKDLIYISMLKHLVSVCTFTTLVIDIFRN